jgi:hypothetical protein
MTTTWDRPTMVTIYLLTGADGEVATVSMNGGLTSLTPDFEALRDELQAAANTGTLDESQIPAEVQGTWTVVRRA